MLNSIVELTKHIIETNNTYKINTLKNKQKITFIDALRFNLQFRIIYK